MGSLKTAWDNYLALSDDDKEMFGRLMATAKLPGKRGPKPGSKRKKKKTSKTPKLIKKTGDTET